MVSEFAICCLESEDLGMTLKVGKAWGLLIPLSIHSFIQQTFGKHQLYARHCLDG